MNLRSYLTVWAVAIFSVGLVAGCNSFVPGEERDSGIDPVDTGLPQEDTGTLEDTGGPDEPDTGGQTEDTYTPDTSPDDSGMMGSDGGDADAQMCSGGGQEICSGSCVDTNSSVDHCGGCGQPCTARAGAEATCNNGMCQYDCKVGFRDENGDLDDPMGDGCEAGSACMPTNQGVEQCDGKDNNCDGRIDEGCDEDGDGICAQGMDVTSGASCQTGPDGAKDCKDSDPEVYPGAPGKCDGKDNDCDGQTDEIDAGPQGNVSFTHQTKQTGSGLSKRKRVVATPTADGFCAAFLDDDRRTLEFVHMKTDGTKTSHTKSFPKDKQPTELLDIAWSGSSCAVLYVKEVNWDPRDDDVALDRWNPSSSGTVHSVTMMKNTYDVNGTPDWDQIGAVHYVRGTGWVVVTIKERNLYSAQDDLVRYQTLTENFTGSTQSPTFNEVAKVAVNSTLRDLPNVDVGPSPRSSDDFAIVIAGRFDPGITSLPKSQIRFYPVENGMVTEQAAARLNMTKDHVAVTLSAHRGKTYLTYYNPSNTRHVRQMRSSYRYKSTGKVRTSGRDPYPMFDIVASSPSLGDWLITPFADEVHAFNSTGGSINFQKYDLSAIGSGDELLAVTSAGPNGKIYILSMTGMDPYATEIDTLTCF